MTTGYAFVVREILARNGIAEADVTYVRAGGTANRYRDLLAVKHDATLLRTPFELLAREHGFNVLATAESLGAYQGTTGIARRSWAAAHERELVGFIRGYRAGIDWLYDRANRDIVEAILVANIRDMTPTLARKSYDLLLADKGGITRDAALDMEGIRTVLALRSKYGLPQKTLTDPAKYVDLAYYVRPCSTEGQPRRKSMAKGSGKRTEPRVVRPGRHRSASPLGPAARGARATPRWISRSASISAGCTTIASPALAPRSRNRGWARFSASISTTFATSRAQ